MGDRSGVAAGAAATPTWPLLPLLRALRRKLDKRSPLRVASRERFRVGASVAEAANVTRRLPRRCGAASGIWKKKG